MIAVLITGGFFLYGPHVFLVATMPSRYHDDSIVAASTGFIDGMGYVGSALIGILVPFIIDMTGSWVNVFYTWAVMALAVIALVGFVYANGKSKRLEN